MTKKKSFLDKKKLILGTLRESGPLYFDALVYETEMDEIELLGELFKYVQKGWVVIKNGSMPIKPDSILDLNYLR